MKKLKLFRVKIRSRNINRTEQELVERTHTKLK